MKMIGFLFGLALITGCGSYDQSASVTDAEKDQVLILRNAKEGHVYSLRVRGIGNIEGQATISLILHGKPYKTKELSGPVRFNWGGDWYSNTAEVVYRPKGVRSGELVLEYEFSTLSK